MEHIDWSVVVLLGVPALLNACEFWERLFERAVGLAGLALLRLKWRIRGWRGNRED